MESEEMLLALRRLREEVEDLRKRINEKDKTIFEQQEIIAKLQRQLETEREMQLENKKSFESEAERLLRPKRTWNN